jgi:hypothetical protein
MPKSIEITAAKKAGSSPKKGRIRKRGKKAAVSTATGKETDDVFGFMAGKVTITGDIVSPALSPKEWGSLYPSSRPRRPRR